MHLVIIYYIESFTNVSFMTLRLRCLRLNIKVELFVYICLSILHVSALHVLFLSVPLWRFFP